MNKAERKEPSGNPHLPATFVGRTRMRKLAKLARGAGRQIRHFTRPGTTPDRTRALRALPPPAPLKHVTFAKVNAAWSPDATSLVAKDASAAFAGRRIEGYATVWDVERVSDTVKVELSHCEDLDGTPANDDFGVFATYPHNTPAGEAAARLARGERVRIDAVVESASRHWIAATATRPPVRLPPRETPPPRLAALAELATDADARPSIALEHDAQRALGALLEIEGTLEDAAAYGEGQITVSVTDARDAGAYDARRVLARSANEEVAQVAASLRIGERLHLRGRVRHVTRDEIELCDPVTLVPVPRPTSCGGGNGYDEDLA